jgi:hypothetical protein
MYGQIQRVILHSKTPQQAISLNNFARLEVLKTVIIIRVDCGSSRAVLNTSTIFLVYHTRQRHIPDDNLNLICSNQ